MHLIKTDFLILRSLSLCDERVAFTKETHHILAQANTQTFLWVKFRKYC